VPAGSGRTATMGISPALSELCEVGVFGDELAWAGALRAYRRQLHRRRVAPAEAAQLGALLTLAGRSARALEIFALLDRTARRAIWAAVWRGIPGQRPRLRRTRGAGRRAPGGSVVEPREFNRQGMESSGDLLAALVLSGRWDQARRCCQRMVREDPLAARELGKKPPYIRFSATSDGDR